jgi:hypothetical protein
MINKIFFHIAKIGNYQNICDEIFEYIQFSNILKDSELYLSVVGNIGELVIPNDVKYEIVYENDNEKVCEFPTLTIIRNMSIEIQENFNILYIHTKGVSTPYNECINDWRKYMSYFNIIKYEDCLNILKENDTCGVDLRKEPTLHYSGNYWWAKSEYIKKLPTFDKMKLIISERHKAEFWICSVDGNHYSMFDCGINQYEKHLHRYNENMYKNK